MAGLSARAWKPFALAAALAVACGGSRSTGQSGGGGSVGGGADGGTGGPADGGTGGGADGGTGAPADGGTSGGGAGSLAPIDGAIARIQAQIAQGKDLDLPAIQNLVLSDPQLQLVSPPSHGSLWVSMGADGPLAVFAVDPTPIKPGAQRSALAHPKPRSPDLTFQLPGQPTYRLYESLGAGFADVRGTLVGLLQANGYATAGVGDGTLSELRSITDASTGVLVLAAHGGFATAKDNKQYASLWTATPYVLPLAEQDYNDLVAHRLVVMGAVDHVGPNNTEVVEVHFAITPLFVQQYIRLAPDAFVYVIACHGGEMFSMADAFRSSDVGASLYAGWDAAVYSPYYETPTYYLFDRLLGANKVQPESPPQRAFDYASVGDDMKAKGLDTLPGPDGPGHLTFIPLSGGMGLLAPSISTVDVDEVAKTLTLHGLFGSRQGLVTVESERPPIHSWAADQIVTDLPSGGGEVAASLNGTRLSNDNQAGLIGVPLTEWKNLEVHFSLDGPGTLMQDVTFHLHLRADVQSYREAPHTAPKFRVVNFLVADDSTATFANSGIDYGPYGGTVQWNGSGALQLTRDNRASTGFYGGGTIDAQQRIIHLQVKGSADGAWGWIVKGPGGERDFTLPLVTLPQPGTTWTIDLPLDDKLNVAGGQLPSFGASEGGTSVTAQWSWKTSSATTPPDDSGAR